ncbi:hypothetical protein BDF19DRAFT_452248 [Syncephalis fuscata]|nr:hypothetical protein BDF19DRAFT_452248 [Syncephalis fuscata]
MLRYLHFTLAYCLLASQVSVGDAAAIPDSSALHPAGLTSSLSQWEGATSGITTNTAKLYKRHPQADTQKAHESLNPKHSTPSDSQTSPTSRNEDSTATKQAVCSFATPTPTANQSPALTTRTVSSTASTGTTWLRADQLPAPNSQLKNSQVYCIDECGNYYASTDNGATWVGPYHVASVGMNETDAPEPHGNNKAEETTGRGIGVSYTAEKDQCGQVWETLNGGMTWTRPSTSNHIARRQNAANAPGVDNEEEPATNGVFTGVAHAFQRDQCGLYQQSTANGGWAPGIFTGYGVAVGGNEQTRLDVDLCGKYWLSEDGGKSWHRCTDEACQ